MAQYVVKHRNTFTFTWRGPQSILSYSVAGMANENSMIKFTYKKTQNLF
jgi:hypothetical protein